MSLPRLVCALLVCCAQVRAQETLRLEALAPDGVTRFVRQWRAPGQKPVALALRGGSAKALAHLGVLQRFEEEGILVGGLTGTSGGALVAGFMGAGYAPSTVQQLFKDLDFSAPLDDRQRTPGRTLSEDESRRSLLFELDVRQGRLDLMPGQERSKRLNHLLWSLLGRAYLEVGSDFDQGRVPIRIVASDLTTGDPWVFRKGYLPQAVQASMSIPGILAPVRVDGHQLVDGGMVENLPVNASRLAFPGMLQVGVDIGRSWDSSDIWGPGVLMGRALDTSMRQVERLSREQADLIIAPDTDAASDFEFQKQVDLLVGKGRQAFDAQLPALEGLLYGPKGAEPVARSLRVAGPAPAGLAALEAAWLPAEGPLLRRDLYRFLRHLHLSLPVQDARIVLPSTPAGEATLHLQQAPPIRTVQVDLAEGLAPGEADAIRRCADRPGLRPGEPFDDRALDACFRETAFGATLTSFRGTGFDPAEGVLTLKARPIRLKALTVEGGASAQAFQATWAPLLGLPIHVEDLQKRMALTVDQFGCTGLGGAVEGTSEGVVMRLRPEWERVLSVGVQVAYETTWSGQVGFDARLRNALGHGSTATLQGSFNSLQQQALAALGQTFSSLPGAGGEVYGYRFKEAFPANLYLPSSTLVVGTGAFLRYEGAGLGLWQRFGPEDKAKVRLDFDQRSARSAFSDGPEQHVDSQALQASLEWDSLEDHLLPVTGTVLRVRAGDSLKASGHEDPATRNPAEGFQYAYLQGRHLWDLPGLGLGLDLGLESGLGWNTPLDRWFVLGGSNSIIGTASASYLVPTFATASLGVPFTSVGVLGLGVQLMPRVDWTRVASTPQGLSSGARVLGTGLIVRSIVRNFYVEIAFGQTQTRGANTQGTRKNDELSFLVGARPFDLWKHR